MLSSPSPFSVAPGICGAYNLAPLTTQQANHWMQSSQIIAPNSLIDNSQVIGQYSTAPSEIPQVNQLTPTSSLIAFNSTAQKMFNSYDPTVMYQTTQYKNNFISQPWSGYHAIPNLQNQASFPIFHNRGDTYQQLSNATPLKSMSELSFRHQEMIGKIKRPKKTHKAQGIEVPNDMKEPTQTEMENFAKEFKQKRISFGFTQADVGNELGKLYGNAFSQTTICRFEAMQLSFRNMCKLRPILLHWINEVDSRKNSNYLSEKHEIKRRKKRTSLSSRARMQLETQYRYQPKPSALDISDLSANLNLDKEVVRVWFCNRRQKDRRLKGITPLSLHELQNCRNSGQLGHNIQQSFASQDSPLDTSPQHSQLICNMDTLDTQENISI